MDLCNVVSLNVEDSDLADSPALERLLTENMQDLFKQMDQANDALDILDKRSDSLLMKLDTVLLDFEARDLTSEISDTATAGTEMNRDSADFNNSNTTSEALENELGAYKDSSCS